MPMGRLRRHLTVPNVLATLLLAAVLATGLAVAAGGPNVRKVDGVEIRGFKYEAPASTPDRVILRAGALRMHASCDNDGDLGVAVRSTADDSTYLSHGDGGADEQLEMDAGNEGNIPVDGQRDIVFRSGAGQVVAVHYAADDNDPLGNRAECLVSGYTFVR
jgi:hypothetical protein